MSFEADLFIDITDDAKSSFSGQEFHERGCDFESFPDSYYFLSLDLEVQSASPGRLVVKVGMERATIFSEIGPKGAKKLGCRELKADEIRERLDVLARLAPVIEMNAKCGFAVGVNDLPENGIIRQGLGVHARFQEDELRLAGAQFAINGDTQNTISWFVETGCDNWESVLGSVFARETRALDDTAFAETVEWAQRQFRRYILETDSVSSA